MTSAICIMVKADSDHRNNSFWGWPSNRYISAPFSEFARKRLNWRSSNHRCPDTMETVGGRRVEICLGALRRRRSAAVSDVLIDNLPLALSAN
jgi:hypothetical protein